MTTPLWCLVIGVVLPYVLAGVGGRYKAQQLGDVDINEPRAQAAQLTGAGGRAVAAQENAWEALAVFTAAVVINHLVTGGAGLAGVAAMVWVVARIVHAVAYIQGIAVVRVAGFFVGVLCSLALIGMAATA